MTGDISNNVSVVIRSRSFREQTKVDQHILLTVNQGKVLVILSICGILMNQLLLQGENIK